MLRDCKQQQALLDCGNLWMKKIYQQVGLIAAIPFAELQICIFRPTERDQIGVVCPVGRRTV